MTMSDAEKLDMLIRTIDEGSDPLHGDVTPAVLELGDLGLPVASRVLDLFESSNALTRLHAQRALQAIISRHFGFRNGQGFPDDASENQVRALWYANGDYEYDAPLEQRTAATQKWRVWVARQNS